MKIIIASDLAPTDTNENLFIDSKIRENIDNDFWKIWDNSDFRIINLETVLGNKKNLTPLTKTGPNLICSSECINGIKELNPTLVLLSNNHILDYGVSGLDNTINILEKEKINYIGIINNKYTELKPFLLEKDGIKVGIYNVCENEFSVASEKQKGANPFIESKCYYEINKYKKHFDKLIVVFHGGKEFYRYPSPNLERVAHAFIDFGADAVIVQHTHCIGCEEIYANKKILYGQGNFIFNNDKYVYDTNLIDTSLLVEISIDKNNIDFKYYPINRKNELIELSKDNSIMEEFNKRSKQIKNNNFIEENYMKFADQNINNYLKFFDRKRFINRVINKFLIKNFYIKLNKRTDILSILNIIECEAHRELLIKGLKNQLKK